MRREANTSAPSGSKGRWSDLLVHGLLAEEWTGTAQDRGDTS